MGMAMDSVTVAKIIREFFLKDKKMIVNEISTLHFQFNLILVCLLLVSY